MRSDRAADLHLSREKSERALDQEVADRLRAENFARSMQPRHVFAPVPVMPARCLGMGMSTPDAPVDPDWAPVPLRD